MPSPDSPLLPHRSYSSGSTTSPLGAVDRPAANTRTLTAGPQSGSNDRVPQQLALGELVARCGSWSAMPLSPGAQLAEGVGRRRDHPGVDPLVIVAERLAALGRLAAPAGPGTRWPLALGHGGEFLSR